MQGFGGITYKPYHFVVGVFDKKVHRENLHKIPIYFLLALIVFEVSYRHVFREFELVLLYRVYILLQDISGNFNAVINFLTKCGHKCTGMHVNGLTIDQVKQNCYDVNAFWKSNKWNCYVKSC